MKMNLGQFTDAVARLKPDTIVRFAFGGLPPHEFGSYRGNYSHISIGFGTELTDGVTAEKLLAKCRAADGAMFYGYKGGEFVMDRRTPLWVANYGDCTNTTICDVRDLGYGYAAILTDYEES